jgi:hypothetical protein
MKKGLCRLVSLLEVKSNPSLLSSFSEDEDLNIRLGNMLGKMSFLKFNCVDISEDDLGCDQIIFSFIYEETDVHLLVEDNTSYGVVVLLARNENESLKDFVSILWRDVLDYPLILGDQQNLFEKWESGQKDEKKERVEIFVDSMNYQYPQRSIFTFGANDGRALKRLSDIFYEEMLGPFRLYL